MSYHIMIIDEDEVAADLIKDALSLRGLYSTLVAQGQGAAQRIVEEKPDLVILDMLLSDGDCEQICRLVRAQSSVPIILQTTRCAAAEGLLPINLGADDYVTKPCDPNEIAQKVEQLLQDRQVDEDVSILTRLAQFFVKTGRAEHRVL